MALSYPLSLPTAPADVTLKMIDVAGVSASPWTGEQQVHLHQGAWWEAEFQLPNLSAWDAARWRAFLAGLRGVYGTFILSPYADLEGAGGGTPVVSGGSQTGSELNTAGWSASTLVLKAGDYVQFANELKVITADATSDVAGLATLDIWPPIRTSPADASSIAINNPVGLFRLTDRQRWVKRSAGEVYSGMTVMCREVI